MRKNRIAPGSPFYDPVALASETYPVVPNPPETPSDGVPINHRIARSDALPGG